MLTSIILMLQPIKDSAIAVSHGELAYASEFNTIGNIDTDMGNPILALQNLFFIVYLLIKTFFLKKLGEMFFLL